MATAVNTRSEAEWLDGRSSAANVKGVSGWRRRGSTKSRLEGRPQ